MTTEQKEIQDQLDPTSPAVATEPKVYPRWHLPEPDDYEDDEYRLKVISAYVDARMNLLSAIVMLDSIIEHIDEGKQYPTSIIERFLKQFRVITFEEWLENEGWEMYDSHERYINLKRGRIVALLKNLKKEFESIS